ncbi:MAG: hypothetical protein M3Y27_21910 [Acidobacteriota bacterium]|nr:hypothetical protein [Acidobacteriota bacterium]
MIRRMFVATAAAACVLTADVSLWSQQDAAPGVPVSVVVTLEAKHGKTIPAVEQRDIKVKEYGTPRSVTGLTPLRGDHASLQLMLLIDDSSGSSFDTEIGEIKQWIKGLPQPMEIAIAYMHNGLAQVTQRFTADLNAAANSIRVPLGAGGADVSPYDSLSDAIKSWPKGNAERREVVMISSGIEGLGGGLAPENQYVNKSIADAQRAGVVVYTIYNPSVGHFGHTFWREIAGQNLLSQMADETGGESYIQTFGAPVSFAPFLDEISTALQHQYLLTFVARAEKKPGLQPVKVRVTADNADITAPDEVFVKAST